jgi:hypothetical protein
VPGGCLLFLNLVPRILAEILAHVPTVAAQTFQWRELLSRSRPLFGRWNQPTPSLEDLNRLKTLFLPKSIQVVAPGPLASQFSTLDPAHDAMLVNTTTLTSSPELAKEAGNRLLLLYFMQLHQRAPLFLDLRERHFRWDPQEESLLWRPNNLWIELEDGFVTALLQLYRGFYRGDPQLVKECLPQLGLINPAHPKQAEQQAELLTLLRDQFGEGAEAPVQFKLSEFNHSFIKLFDHFIHYKVRLHSDFIFLGLYLITLYEHLEKLGVPLDVKSAYLEATLATEPGT